MATRKSRSKARWKKYFHQEKLHFMIVIKQKKVQTYNRIEKMTIQQKIKYSMSARALETSTEHAEFFQENSKTFIYNDTV